MTKTSTKRAVVVLGIRNIAAPTIRGIAGVGGALAAVAGPGRS